MSPGILWQVRSTMPGTWVGHGLVALYCLLAGVAVAYLAPPETWVGAVLAAVPLVVLGDWRWLPVWALACGLLWWLGGGPALGGLIGSGAALAYYLIRERADKRYHLDRGTYTELARLDRVGDLVAAAFVHATAWAMYSAGLL